MNSSSLEAFPVSDFDKRFQHLKLNMASIELLEAPMPTFLFLLDYNN